MTDEIMLKKVFENLVEDKDSLNRDGISTVEVGFNIYLTNEKVNVDAGDLIELKGFLVITMDIGGDRNKYFYINPDKIEKVEVIE